MWGTCYTGLKLKTAEGVTGHKGGWRKIHGGAISNFYEMEEDWWGMQLGYVRNLCEVLVGKYG
jgi:hypothetical protein